MKRTLLFICLTAAFLMAAAQKPKVQKPIPETPVAEVDSSAYYYTDSILGCYMDSLALLRSHYDTQWTYKGNDLLKNPYYYRLFLSPTFYYSPIAQQMSNEWVGRYNRLLHPYSLGLDLSDTQLQVDSAINRSLADFYIASPQSIRDGESTFRNTESLRKDTPTKIEHRVELKSIIDNQALQDVIEPVKVVGYRPNFWKFAASTSFSFMQYHYSDNWYRGGDNYNNFSLTLNMSANYNNQRGITFNNSISANLGYATVKSDTEHRYRPTADQIRMVNQIGITAIKKWSYTFTLQSWTQMVPHYNANSKVVYNDFLSPLDYTASIGMRFTHNKGKLNFSMNIDPFSYNFRYVDRKALLGRYGLRPGDHTNDTFGANITANWTVNGLIKNLTWTSRVYYFSNLKKAQAEWENTINFKISKYLSTRIYLYPRFDDHQREKEGGHHIQYHEQFSLAFNYTF